MRNNLIFFGCVCGHVQFFSISHFGLWNTRQEIKNNHVNKQDPTSDSHRGDRISPLAIYILERGLEPIPAPGKSMGEPDRDMQ